MLTRKYLILNSETWEFDVLYEANISLNTLKINICTNDSFNIQNNNKLVFVFCFLFFWADKCEWFKSNSICNQLQFFPNQIEFLSLPVKKCSTLLTTLIEDNILCGSLPRKFHTNF